MRVLAKIIAGYAMPDLIMIAEIWPETQKPEFGFFPKSGSESGSKPHTAADFSVLSEKIRKVFYCFTIGGKATPLFYTRHSRVYI
ncbi:MAG: hypothetical protein ACOCP6_01365 [Desulfosalsimonas sp.]